MGTQVVKVPDVGEGIAEVEVVAWAVSVGDTVARNQVLAEVMTDKANVEIPAPADGVVAVRNGEVGEILAVGTTLLELTVDGEPSGEPPPPAPAPVSAPASVSTPVAPAEAVGTPPAGPEPSASVSAPAVSPAPTTASGPPRAEGERPLASPAVRHRARQGGIDLRLVRGTGPAGRITHDDLDAYWHGAAPASAASPRGGPAVAGTRSPDRRVTEEPIIGIRRQIARRTLTATQTIPHITYVDEVDVTALESLRSAFNDRYAERAVRLTLLPFLIRAMVDAIADHPQMNAHVDDETETLTTYGGVHVGIATQTPNGLVVPVVRHAEAESLWSLAAKIGDLATRSRDGGVTPAELTGSTITITSLGSLGGLVTTPVLNKPEVAIIGVNKIVTRPTYLDEPAGGPVTPVPRKVMNLSSSFDHRIVDGWDAAQFVQKIKASLEEPALLLVDGPSPGGPDGGAGSTGAGA